jgi:hypothetical protein
VALPAKCVSLTTGVPSTIPSITGPLTGLCGQTIVYTCPFQQGVNYSWLVPGGSTINSGQGTNAISVTFGTFATSTVSVQGTNGCGTGNLRSITVKGPPNAPSAIASIPSTWCANTSGVEFDVNVSNLSGSYTLNWQYPNASVAQYVLGGGNSTSLILNWLTGSGPVNVTASNACGNATKMSTWASTCREGEDVQLANGSLQLAVYPNPINTIATVEFVCSENSTTTIDVTDIAGRLISSQTMNTTTGLNTMQLDVSKVAKGVYTLKVNSNDKTEIKKVVIE